MRRYLLVSSIVGFVPTVVSGVFYLFDVTLPVISYLLLTGSTLTTIVFWDRIDRSVFDILTVAFSVVLNTGIAATVGMLVGKQFGASH